MPKAVVDAPALRLHSQPCLNERPFRGDRTRVAQQPVPALRHEAQAVRLARGREDTTRVEVGACLNPFRPLDLGPEPSARHPEGLPNPLQRIGALSTFVRKRNPRPRGKVPHRLGKGHLLVLHEKREHIPPGPAAEAVKRLHRRVHVERRCLLPVEGAETREARAGLAEGDVLAHDGNDIARLPHPLHEGITSTDRHRYLWASDFALRAPES